MKPIFITGIGTGVGKTLVSAIVTEALDAFYWKPIQAGFDEGTDAGWVAQRLSGGPAGSAGTTGIARVLREAYRDWRITSFEATRVPTPMRSKSWMTSCERMRMQP